MLNPRLEKIAGYGERYRQEYLDLGDSDPGMDSDPFRLRFFLSRMFAGDETVADYYLRSTEKVLRENEDEIRSRFTEDGGISAEDLDELLDDGGVGSQSDRTMVVEIIEFVESIPENNHDVLEHTENKIKMGELEELFDDLTSIYNVSDSKAAAYLRDAAVYLGIEDEVTDGQENYLVPVDVHIHKAARELGLIETETPEWEADSEAVVEACTGVVSPVDFCFGAVYLGRKSYQVLFENLENLEVFPGEIEKPDDEPEPTDL